MAIKICECCQYTTPYLSVFTKHLKSKRHNVMKNADDNNQTNFQCKKCNKKYGTQSGLWKHTKKCDCIPIENVMIRNNNDIMSMEQMRTQIMELKKQLSELQTSITDNNCNKNIHVYLNT